LFKKILIANRGEIALRVIRACRELGVKTVAVYSEADRDSLHVRFSDEDVCIGPAPGSKSYLDPKRIIAAAEVTNADAIHPGYGFMAENAEFAEICESCDITFIGPTPKMIRSMGDKGVAKKLMREAGIPVIPGSEGIVKSLDEAVSVAAEIGYPVLIKAVAGGGGRGMRYCRDAGELRKYFGMARAEAEISFGNPDVYIEKVILNPHHVEIQLMGDYFGNIVHFGERDCSVQRRHQKLVEETPSPVVTAELRGVMGRTAVRGASTIQYLGAGTMEFLVDADRNFYFMEMNTRIQVEHPITEEATEVDLVKEQIRVAAGERLAYHQEDIILKWHAMECRINAEDPEKGFRPTPGKITSFHVPGGHGVRVDTHAYAEYTIPPFYDSMIAKLIVRAGNRREAIDKMRFALEEFFVEGIPTTIEFHKKILSHPDFVSGDHDTSLIEKMAGEISAARIEANKGIEGDK
jgi:acetyl-CoA carboxylase biotin carboxylase subunit